MNEITTDRRRARLTALAKWGIGLAGAVVIAPMVFLAVKGIIGLALAGVLGLALVHGAPVAAMKFANWRLRGLKHEARVNPIETRQNIALQARQRILDGKQELTNLSTEVRNFADQVKALRASQPEDADEFQGQLEGLQRLLKFKSDSLAKAEDNLREFERATERAANKWRVAQAAIRMQKLTGAAADDEMNKLLAAESLDAVQSAMNRALSELDTALAMQQLPAPVSPATIDVKAAEVLERIRA